VAILSTRNDLRRDRFGGQAQPRERRGFDIRPQMGVKSHGTGDFSEPDLVAGPYQTRGIASGLLEPADELQTQSVRLGVDSVRPADHHGRSMLVGLTTQHLLQLLQIAQQDRSTAHGS